MRMGLRAKECMWPPEAGKGTRMDSPLEPLEKTVNTLTLGPMTSRTVREYIGVVLSHWFCGDCYSSNRKLTSSHLCPGSEGSLGDADVRRAESSSSSVSVKSGSSDDEGAVMLPSSEIVLSIK